MGFRRDALDRAGLTSEREFWKTFALWRLAAQGERFWVDSELNIRRRRQATASTFIHERYIHGRCFGANRLTRRPFPVRLAREASCLAVPHLFTARLGRDVLPDHQYRGVLCRSVGHLLVFNTAWALGELAGYLHGAGDACRQLT